MEAIAQGMTWFTLGVWVGGVCGLALSGKVGARVAKLAPGEHRGVPHLPEAQAQRQLVELAIERGAEDILARNPTMSRKEARRKAAELWEKAGDPLGGVL